MRGGLGLFETVTGFFANGFAVDEFDAAAQAFLSVQDNIQRILNSRRRDDLVTSRLMTANPGSEQLLAATDAAAEAGTDLAAGPLM